MQSFIALGGNLGSVEETFQSALAALDASPDIEVRQVSSSFRTPPMGQEAGEPYLNAAAELDANCPPLELLDHLQAIEIRHGRERTKHWGPRTLDLDLLLYGEDVLIHPRLTLPHPGCWYRRFVLDPLAEIAPHVLHPIKKLTFGELRTRLLERPLRVGLAGGGPADRQQLAAELSAAFCDIHVSFWTPADENPPTLLLWLGPPGDHSLTFAELPLRPRLDLTGFPEPTATATRHVLSAALLS